jgi:DNA-binding winged helix-turn-helix (wHTH) protein
MWNSQNLLSGKRKYLCALILLVFGCAICMAFGIGENDDFNMARREVLLRDIGHEMLLKSGDSTSRVLAVEKIAENEYQVRFEKALTFQPDYLVNTTSQLLAKDPLANNYVVNVVNGSKASVTYGYAISKNKKNDIVPCRGRIQPTAPYRLNFKFEPTFIKAHNGYLLGSLPFLAFVGFIFLRSGKPQKDSSNSKLTGIFTFGSVSFDPQKRQLVINNETIELTGTETRLLLIFASSPNQTIARGRLQKEIWEDEGVIVGRSLDMFISKLRKKLELDPDSTIVVIRGKGYKLEVSA